MCVSLSKVSVDDDDGWEQMKRNRAGAGMVKFIRQGSTSSVKKEEAPEDEDMNSKEQDDEATIKPEHEDDNTDATVNVKTEDDATSPKPLATIKEARTRGRLLVVVGTYSIGKERICIGIAKALHSKIYCPPGKMRMMRILPGGQ